MIPWRFIDTGPGNAFSNMAVDEAIARLVREGRKPPALRLYEWETPSVSLGYFQKTDSINTAYCVEKNMPVVRRLTGGRAVFHHHELTYSFSAITSHGVFSGSLKDSYKKINEALCLSVSMAGLSPETRLTKNQNSADYTSKNSFCFYSAAYGEVILNNRKIIGSAQKRWKDGLLQQGSIPFSLDEDEIKNVFGISCRADLRTRMLGLREAAPELTLKKFKEIVRAAFEEIFHVEFIHAPLSQEEIRLALELEVRKYQTPEWNFQR